eukprot:TRINITY_DN395_c2_g1_i1.p2 TRINITY_DN395_c2_g1~~TRINITY_DN395_c2_g1_i1.p2  ORF type:complete len:302 (+),score=119.78 TRINITY_DN395_c2_g1_i1:2558-3463(+)
MGAVKSKLAWKRFAGRGGTAGGAPAGGEKQLVAETQTMLKWLKKKRKAKGITVLGGGTCTAVRAVVDGEVRVFKVRYSAAQVENEQRANALYARFGAAVPEVRVERIDGAEGVACMSQRYIEGTSLLALELQREKFEAGGDAASAAGVKAHLRAAHDALGEHFLLDCVFGNWDVIGARGRTGGDNVLVGSHDSAVMWYDLDMSDKPYKKLTSHKSGVNTVRYHPQPRVYPLFASAGDNGQIHVFHGRVYDDLTQNPYLVPLKIIKAHQVTEGVGILHLAFHPTLPWLFSAAADGTVRCWTE